MLASAACAQEPAPATSDPAAILVGRLELGRYKATDYPANVGPHMTNTDSSPFMDYTPSLSLREVECGAQMGAGGIRSITSLRVCIRFTATMISGWD